MKKYFKNVTIFTLEESKTIVANNSQLAFTFDEIINKTTGSVYVHNQNGENRGRTTWEFRLQEDGNWKIR